MRINEVEALVGITKKNIRFYEDAGLISPQRNSQNGYREYSEPDVEMLRRIKLLRKLGFSLEEIRQMQQGTHTVGDGMRRHLISLQREQANLASAARLCERLTACPEKLDALDAQALLVEMETMEQKGTTFMDKQKQDQRRRRYAAPIIASGIGIVSMALALWFLWWAIHTDPANAPPTPLVVFIMIIPVVVAFGVFIALTQRISEISRGEEDEAKKY